MSAADTISLNNGEKLRQTGVFLNEFYLAYQAIDDAGYQIDFATPDGIKATIDQESLKDDYWEDYPKAKEEALDFVKNNKSFLNPMSLEKALKNQGEYIGLVVPGGQGLSVDLMYDPHIPTLLKSFANENKVIGLICHAPCLILTIPKEENPFIGYEVNSISLLEELFIETFVMKGRPDNNRIGRRLDNLGLDHDSGWPKADYAIRDRNLVSSQNPFSSKSFNRLYLEALKDYGKQKGDN